MSEAAVIYLGGVFGSIFQISLVLCSISLGAFILTFRAYCCMDKSKTDDATFLMRVGVALIILFLITILCIIFVSTKESWLAMHGIKM